MLSFDFSPSAAWETIPASDWNLAAARHLLRRAGFAAIPVQVREVHEAGVAGSLALMFRGVPAFPKPYVVQKLADSLPSQFREMRSSSEDERRTMRQEYQEQSRDAIFETMIQWLRLASDPRASAFEKWAFFLSDVFVIGAEKVRNAAMIYDHQSLIRRGALGKLPVLAKAVSRSPAMIEYLDLQQSKRDSPNENFARELFELFLLGEGNYKEADIKEAARAFTGYRQQFGQFQFAQRQHDPGRKTVFGQSGRFTGDDVIDLCFRQAAARTHVPGEMMRFYVSEEPIPDEYLAALGDWWAGTGFDLQALAIKVFSSRLFFDSSLRGNFIKSPIQFYIGLLQDLNLDVIPLPRRMTPVLRQMGQVPYSPPNVRGWVGGRQWINSSTLAARRSLVHALFEPFDDARLNADELIDIVAARADGHGRFSVSDERLRELAKEPSSAIASQFIDNFLPGSTSPEFRAALEAHLGSAQPTGAIPLNRIKQAAVAVLQSPEYQLC